MRNGELDTSVTKEKQMVSTAEGGREREGECWKKGQECVHRERTRYFAAEL